DELHDVLRRVGELDRAELAARHAGDGLDAELAALIGAGRAAVVRIAGVERVIAAEDVARYRDGLGVVPPQGVPVALLEPSVEPLISLIVRYARSHAPFPADGPAARWGLAPAQIEPVLALLAARGQLVRGELRPGGSQLDSCDPE